MYDGITLVGNVTVGNDADAIAYNPQNQDVYVASYGYNKVYILSGIEIVASINVGEGPDGLAYNPLTSDMYVVAQGFVTAGEINILSSG